MYIFRKTKQNKFHFKKLAKELDIRSKEIKIKQNKHVNCLRFCQRKQCRVKDDP